MKNLLVLFATGASLATVIVLYCVVNGFHVDLLGFTHAPNPDPPACLQFSQHAGCKEQDPHYLYARQAIEEATEGPLLDVNSLIKICNETQRAPKPVFLVEFNRRYHEAVDPLLEKGRLTEAFATSAAFFYLNFGFSFFIDFSTEYRKRSVWKHVLVGKRNRTILFQNQNQLKRVEGHELSTDEVLAVMGFEKRLTEEQDDEYVLTSYADGHYFNAYLDYIARTHIIDARLLNASFHFYAPKPTVAAFADSQPRAVRLYLRAVLERVLHQKYAQLYRFDCHAIVQDLWPRTISKLLEDQALPQGDARDAIDRRLQETFVQVKYAAAELLHELDLKDPELNQKIISVLPDLTLQFKEPSEMDRVSRVLELLTANPPKFKWDFVKTLKAFQINGVLGRVENTYDSYPLALSANLFNHYNWSQELDDATWYGVVGVEIAKLFWRNVGNAIQRTEFDVLARKQASCVKKRYNVSYWKALDRVYEKLEIHTAFSAFQHYQTYNNKPKLVSADATQFFVARQQQRQCSERGTPIPLREYYGFLNQFRCRSMAPQCDLWPLSQGDVFVEPEQWSIKLNAPEVEAGAESAALADAIESRMDLTARPCLAFHRYACLGVPESQFGAGGAERQRAALRRLRAADERFRRALAAQLRLYGGTVLDAALELLLTMPEEARTPRLLAKWRQLRDSLDWRDAVRRVGALKSLQSAKLADDYDFGAGGLNAMQVRAVLEAVRNVEANAPAGVWYATVGLHLGRWAGHAFDLFGSQLPSLTKTKNATFTRLIDVAEHFGVPMLDELANTAMCLNRSFGFAFQRIDCDLNVSQCREDFERLNQAFADIVGLRAAQRAREVHILRHGAGRRPAGPLAARMTSAQLFFIRAAQTLCAANRPQDGLQPPPRVLLPTERRVRAALANLPAFSAAFNCPVGCAYRPDGLECPVLSGRILGKNRDPFERSEF